MKKIVIITCMLTSMASYGAGFYYQPELRNEAVVKFKDKPGEYLIKIETVKDVRRSPGSPIEKYTPVTTKPTVYEQKEGSKSFSTFIELPDEAEFVRISVRRMQDGKATNQGDYIFISRAKLREGIRQYKGKMSNLGIFLTFNKLRPNKLEYELDMDSVY